MNRLTQDLRYAFRRARKNRVFTFVIVLTLAVGIGANTAIFTVTHAVMIKTLPVADPDRLYRLGDAPICCLQSGLQDDWGLFSTSLYQQFRDHTPAFEELAAFQAGEIDLSIRRTGNAIAEHSLGEFVTGNYFLMFGIQPTAGRNISPTDDRPEAPPVAMMSHRFWQQHYGFDRSVVGSVVTINGTQFTIVGVAARGFFGDTLRENPPDLWMPLAAEPLLRPQNSLLQQPNLNWLYVMGRLKRNSHPQSVAAHVTVELRHWLSNQPHPSESDNARISKQVIRLTRGATGIAARLYYQYSRGLILLMAVAGFVLLIACANIANLFLARGRILRQQLSVCLALGATRARLVCQLITESAAIAIFGGALALVVAFAGSRALLALAFRGADYVPISPDPSLPVLGFTFILTLLTALFFGVVPAWITSQSDPSEALRGSNRSTDFHSAPLQKTMVVVQAAISVVLLIAAGLLAKSLLNLETQRLGFDTNGRWFVNFDPELGAYSKERLMNLYEQLQQRLREIPGVKRASISTYSPMSGYQWDDDVYVEGGSATGPSDRDASWNRISPEYFETVGTALLQGRTITEQDTPTSRHVAVINQSFARKFFGPSVTPIGKHFGIGSPQNSGAYEIVGVVADAKYWNADNVPAMFFLPFLQLTPYQDARFAKVDIRSNYARNIELYVSGDPRHLGDSVRHTLAEIDPNLTILGIRSFDEQIALYFNHQRLVAKLTSVLASLALFLASFGIYGVTSYTVVCRTNEIGVRVALGADPRNIVTLLLRTACVEAGIGLGIGIPLALASMRLLSSELYGVSANDPFVFAGAAGVLGACSLVAAFVPAQRAAKIDPIVALRYE